MRVLVAVLLMAALTLSGCIRDPGEIDGTNYVRIHGIDVSAPEVTSGSVLLVVNTTLDNMLAESGDVRLVVKAYDHSTGFLARTEIARPGTLGEDKTVSVPVEMRVPRAKGYRITVEVHEDERLVQEGSVSVSNLDALEPNIHATSLRIDGIDFIVRNVTGGRVEIEAQVMITNEGDDVARSLRMEVKARDIATRLVGDEASRTVGGVGPEESIKFPVRLTVPDRTNYQVEVVLWMGNVSVARGSGLVQLLPTIEKSKDTEIVVSEPRLQDFVRDGNEAAEGARDARSGDVYDRLAGDTANTPGPALVVVLALVGLAAVAAGRRWRR